MNLLRVEVKQRWWVMPYIQALGLFCVLTGLRPDHEKLLKLLMRHGFKIEVKRR